MKRKRGVVSVPIYLLVLMCGMNLYAASPTLVFSSPDSTINVNSPLVLNTDIEQWRGSLRFDHAGTSITGTGKITFDHGTIEGRTSTGGTVEARLTGEYQANDRDLDTIQLRGTDINHLHHLRAEPGTVLQKIEIYQDQNWIEGQPVFQNLMTPTQMNNIVVFDGLSTTRLNIAMQNHLNRNININTGTLILQDDLHLADDVVLDLNHMGMATTGTIDLNKRSLHMPGDDSTWTGSFLFLNATDIELHAMTTLNGTWTFSSTGIDPDAYLNGNGNILDIKDNGIIYVHAGTILHLVDVHLRCLGDGFGQIILEQDVGEPEKSGQVRFHNSDISFCANYTVTTGNWYVEGADTTFMLQEFRLLFDEAARLTVDGVTLWLDTQAALHWPDPGQLKAPYAIFVGHIWNEQNVQIDLGPAGNLSLINSSTIRELSDRSLADSSITTRLLQTELVISLTLDQSVHLKPDERVNIGADLVINGSGAMLVFSNPSCPQFVVQDDMTVTIMNLDLNHINAGTFQLGCNAKIIIGKNVHWGLIDDVVFNKGEIEVIGTEADPNIFYIRGLGGVKRLTFTPDYRRPATSTDLRHRDVGVYPRINLGVNTLFLQDIELTGVAGIGASKGSDPCSKCLLGTIALGGGVIINAEVDNALGYYVYGVNNELRVINQSGNEDGIRFDGKLIFDDYADNVLHFNAAIPSPITSPVVQFGDGFMYVSSEVGRAGLIFDDNYITVRNLFDDSFVLGKHVFLGGRNVTIWQNPIQQRSNDVEFGLDLNLASDQPNAIVNGTPFVYLSPTDDDVFPQDETRAVCAFSLKRAQDFAMMQPVQESRRIVSRPVSRHSAPVPATSAQELRAQAISKPAVPTVPTIVSPALPAVRAFTPPAQVTAYYNNGVSLGNASGIVNLHDGVVPEFGIDTIEQLNLTLRGNTKLIQGEQAVHLKSTDVLNVAGKKNKVIVNGAFILNGTLLFEPGAELTFKFDDHADDPSVTLDLVQVLELDPSTKLQFVGNGTVYLGDGACIVMQGTSLIDKPEIVFSDLVTVKLLGYDVPVKVTGNGRCVFDSGASLVVGAGQQLIFGESESDKISISCNRMAAWQIVGKNARVSLQKGSYSLVFDYNARLAIKDGATFEINCNAGQMAPGTLTRLIFDNDSHLRIRTGGTLLIGRNVGDTPFVCDLQEALISSSGGRGIVHLLEPAASIPFAGRIAPVALLDESIGKMHREIKAAQLVQALVQQQPETLRSSTVFIDANGNRVLRKPNGGMKKLQPTHYVEEKENGRVLVNGNAV